MYLVLLESALPLSRASGSEQGFCCSSMKHAGRALQPGDIIIHITVPSTKGFPTEYGIWRGGFLIDPLTAVPVLREQPIGQWFGAYLKKVMQKPMPARAVVYIGRQIFWHAE